MTAELFHSQLQHKSMIPVLQMQNLMCHTLMHCTVDYHVTGRNIHTYQQ